MNFPYETENSYLSGGNCLNLGVNPPNEVYFKEFLYLCLLLTTHEIICRMKSIKSHITQLLKSLNEEYSKKNIPSHSPYYLPWQVKVSFYWASGSSQELSGAQAQTGF